MRKSLVVYVLIGAALGIIVGLLLDSLAIWLALGAGVGLLIGLFSLRR
jgi:hypothetical protein